MLLCSVSCTVLILLTSSSQHRAHCGSLSCSCWRSKNPYLLTVQLGLGCNSASYVVQTKEQRTELLLAGTEGTKVLADCTCTEAVPGCVGWTWLLRIQFVGVQ